MSAVNWFGQAVFGSPEFDDDAGALISLPVSREAVAIVISPDHLAALAEQKCKGGRPHIRLTKATSPDRWAPQMARMFRDELAGGNGVNELYVDALLTKFGVEVLRRYDDAARPKKSATGGLSFRNEKRIREHLAENFRRKLSVADLVGVCDLHRGLSSWRSQTRSVSARIGI
ncbi:hypothetical protein RZ532_10630 [Nitratireductor aquimarinus]|uniref:hypothetical protein n=1 Tax=Nitratireductor aquimarinus TaxID=889300 RepID=UPI002935ABD0|nr:hypothetical protein [Nitratireductor aquimarinus]MDV2966430.1 hypothetical protein [Nitratireductor aquimarinus]